jgi:hypothetical protein
MNVGSSVNTNPGVNANPGLDADPGLNTNSGGTGTLNNPNGCSRTFRQQVDGHHFAPR